MKKHFPESLSETFTIKIQEKENLNLDDNEMETVTSVDITVERSTGVMNEYKFSITAFVQCTCNVNFFNIYLDMSKHGLSYFFLYFLSSLSYGFNHTSTIKPSGKANYIIV